MSDTTHGYEVMGTDDGNVLQAGMKSTAHPVPFNVAQGWITRAVVLQVYWPEEDDRAWSKDTQRCILCDVRTYGRYSRILSKVPVLQQTHGLWDQDVYIPRPSMQDITGGTLATGASVESRVAPTAAELLDGDHVLVGFLDNDPNQPVVLPFVQAHPKAQLLEKSAGRVRRIRHAGVVVEWSTDGNLTIDATGAAKGEFLKGKEQSNSGAAGKIILVTSDGSNKTSIVLNHQGKILLGSDPAGAAPDEPFVLGNQWKALMGTLIDAISALTVTVGGVPSTTPVNAAAFAALKAQINAGNHLSTFIFGKKVY